MVNFDFSKINKVSVADTCAILNLLSSARFYTATICENFSFCYTSFVEYEFLYKPVQKITETIKSQRVKLQEETKKNRFK